MKNIDRMFALVASVVLTTNVAPLTAMAANARSALTIQSVNVKEESQQHSVAQLIDAGWELMNMDKFEDAEVAFTKALAADPQSVEALYGRAVARYCMNQVELALSDLDEAHKIEPKNVEVLFATGYIQEKSGNTEAALASYAELLSVTPENVDVVWRVANIHYANKNLESCLNDLTNIIGLTPEDPWAYFARGTVYKEMGNKELAKADFEKAAAVYIATSPEYQAIQEELAGLTDDGVTEG